MKLSLLHLAIVTVEIHWVHLHLRVLYDFSLWYTLSVLYKYKVCISVKLASLEVLFITM